MCPLQMLHMMMGRRVGGATTRTRQSSGANGSGSHGSTAAMGLAAHRIHPEHSGIL